ncbi:MAG: phytanoyl-CoA dioxygenase family protein [Caldilineaceae bacterium]|nr:phytanoyl-CoA dioxygenase family protein [Caldilineaceae bacterium]
MTITAQQAAFYKEHGYLGAIDIVDAAQAARYREKFDELEARVGRAKAQIGLIDYHFAEEFIWELATHPRILDAVEAIVGPNFHLLATHFFNKYGEGEQAEAFVAWHQDVTFWGLEPPYAITAWYAVDGSDRENGCMQVIPDTHHGIKEHGKANQKGNLLSINQEVSVTPEQLATAVDLPLRAGQMSLHDGTLIHGSLPNRSQRRRCGLTLRYVPTWVKQTVDNSHGKRWNGILVRGVDAEQNFGHSAPPFPIKSVA